MDINGILKECNFSFQKRYGQNFITDTNLLNAIVLDAQITEDDVVVEVGTGAGTLTRSLSKIAKKVITFEIDKNLSCVLEKTLDGLTNVVLNFCDILSYDREKLNILTGGKYKVVANLPYYITTPVIFYFLDDPFLESLTVMVQREVAERLGAKAGTAEYGAVTAQVNARSSVTLTRIVNKKLFNPIPNVDSAVIRLDIFKREGIKDYALLKKVIATAFEMRRKTLINNLTKAFSISREECGKVLNECGINILARGETLSIEDFIRLSNALESKISSS